MHSTKDHFGGGVGYVVARVRPENGGTVIDSETREFEQQVRQFAREEA